MLGFWVTCSVSTVVGAAVYGLIGWMLWAQYRTAQVRRALLAGKYPNVRLEVRESPNNRFDMYAVFPDAKWGREVFVAWTPDIQEVYRQMVEAGLEVAHAPEWLRQEGGVRPKTPDEIFADTPQGEACQRRDERFQFMIGIIDIVLVCALIVVTCLYGPHATSHS